MSGDLIEYGPRRSGRVWGYVTGGLLVALVVAGTTTRGGERKAAPTPLPPAPTEPAPIAPSPAPALPPAPPLSAPPLATAAPRVTAVDSTRVVRGGRTVYDAPPGRRITSFVPLAGDRFAAVVLEDPQQTANPATLVAVDAGRRTTITVDEETVVFAARPGGRGAFWRAGPGGTTLHRIDGTVVDRADIAPPWSAVGDTVAGLLVTDRAALLGLHRPGRSVHVLTPSLFAFVTTDGRRVVWRDGFCSTGCRLAVHDVLTRETWHTPAPRGEDSPFFERAALTPDGGSVAFVASWGQEFAVYVARRGQPLVRIAATPPGTAAVGTFFVDWVDDSRLAVFEARGPTATFVFDVRTMSLRFAGTVGVRNAEWLYADPA